MTLNGVIAVILRYFSEFAYLPGVLRKSSRSLSHLLMSSCLINWLSYSRLHHFPPKQSLLSITGSTFFQAAVLAVDQVTAFVMNGRKLICIVLIMSHASLGAQVWHVFAKQ